MSLRSPFDHVNSTSVSVDLANESVASEKGNPFETPYGSNAPSAASSQVFWDNRTAPARFFHSRRVKKGEVSKPWLSVKDSKEKWITIIPIMGMLVGLALGALLVWDGLKTVVNNKYCPIYSTDFSEGLDESIWTKEAEVGGFGNGQFEETTITDENVFLRDGMMVIRPTLQDEALITTNSVIDLTQQGICSSTEWKNCITSTNTTNGTIIQPVKSGRVNLKNRAIKYGRIEVEAELPSGDWLWPAIWMLPVNSTYGDWPASGEIDILESRGNDHTFAQGGNNVMSSALHWGPDTGNDAWWRTNNKRSALHTTFAKKFHTFGLEWNEKYLFTYLDSRLMQVMYVNFDSKSSLWERDPWSQTGRPSTPFDEDFYLIINLAVGSQNGWFEDGKSKKPWVDGSPTAKKDFWNARDEWQKTWEEGSPELKIRAVRVWQQQGYNGCESGIQL
ncbi:hypothetical protein LTR05_000453 [Lithohypha guttulata]|uniref:GH16 domain-containing protein n=1 Tax=Lithohypha guttulata TaxID=1690604 RepID=A0AAN7TAM8_9EURO|nr:hypothetical protein LTR05_000453 [Lithohypha guttulata]